MQVPQPNEALMLRSILGAAVQQQMLGLVHQPGIRLAVPAILDGERSQILDQTPLLQTSLLSQEALAGRRGQQKEGQQDHQDQKARIL